VHKKSPRDISPTGSVAQLLGTGSLTHRQDELKQRCLTPLLTPIAQTAVSDLSGHALARRI